MASPFRIYKFRSMVVDAEQQKERLRALNEVGDGMFKITRDPRVTRVGNVLRKTSLDELPQLFNVLRGEMSLVGPRPLVTDEDALVLGLDRSRLHLTPGMTGPWQVLGSRVPMQEMVGIDYLYVANWSLWLDLKLLLRTGPPRAAPRQRVGRPAASPSARSPAAARAHSPTATTATAAQATTSAARAINSIGCLCSRSSGRSRTRHTTPQTVALATRYESHPLLHRPGGPPAPGGPPGSRPLRR